MSRFFVYKKFGLLLIFLSLNVLADATSDKEINTEETITVKMSTELGDIVLELYPLRAPVTVANFLRYVDEDIYSDRAAFYRAVRLDNQSSKAKIEVIQGGLGIATYEAENKIFRLPPIQHETTKQTGILHKHGVISMARLEPGTASSEFFICIGDQLSLDYGGDRNPDGMGYATFGKVIHGFDVVTRIQQARTDKPVPEEFAVVRGQLLSEPVKIHEIIRH